MGTLEETVIGPNQPYYQVISTVQRPWLDIARTGIWSWASQADDLPEQRLELPSALNFYGHPTDHVWINPNGMLALNASRCFHYGPIPVFCDWQSPVGISQYERWVGPLVTDFNPGWSNSSNVYYEWTKDQPDDWHLIVQWDEVRLYRSNTSEDDPSYTFQCELTSNGDIRFNYHKVPIDPSTLPLDAQGSQYYHVIIGLGDINERGERYSPLLLPFNMTSPGSSFLLQPRPTCEQQQGCQACMDFNSSITCTWCADSNSCMDPNGRLKYSCGRHDQHLCPPTPMPPTPMPTHMAIIVPTVPVFSGVMVGTSLLAIAAVIVIVFCLWLQRKSSRAHRAYQLQQDEADAEPAPQPNRNGARATVAPAQGTATIVPSSPSSAELQPLPA